MKNLLFSAFYGNTGIVFLERDLAADIMPEGHSTAFSKDFLQLNWAEEKLKYICLRALKTFSSRQANILLKNN